MSCAFFKKRVCPILVESLYLLYNYCDTEPKIEVKASRTIERNFRNNHCNHALNVGLLLVVDSFHRPATLAADLQLAQTSSQSQTCLDYTS